MGHAEMGFFSLVGNPRDIEIQKQIYCAKQDPRDSGGSHLWEVQAYQIGRGWEALEKWQPLAFQGGSLAKN